jgi:DNA (cytosine-5)-methyltransferase 1
MPVQTQSGLTFIDLFCGCGGFTLGMERVGFQCLAAIDSNPEAIETFKANFRKEITALCKDLTRFSPSQLAAKLNTNSVDVIVGGPPCQGFSTVRQVDAANHGSRVRKDRRRYLYRIFLEYVAAFRPKIFVMENVLGLQSAAKGRFFTRVQAEARNLGYRVQAQVEEAWKLGVPQKRRRQLIIGVRDDIPGYFPGELEPASFVGSYRSPTLWDAIGDLPELAAGTGDDECDYDGKRRAAHLAIRGESARHYLEVILQLSMAARLTGHKARPHSERDLRDFARLKEGEHSGDAEARGEEMEFTYKRTCFKDRYKRQRREGLCSTIVAHLSKDGLGFIHPTQHRSLTPREAARIQSFPDWFLFPVARTHQFRLIGNAVPPLVAAAVGEELRGFLSGENVEGGTTGWELQPLPKDERQAVEWLRPLLDRPALVLRKIGDEEFKRVWFAIAFLYAGLHPDGALDHGEAILRQSTKDNPAVSRIEPRLLAPYYERSGWPVILAPIAREAWRRYRNHKLREEEFYCTEAQMAGMCYRDPNLTTTLAQQRAVLCRQDQKATNRNQRQEDLWPLGPSTN